MNGTAAAGTLNRQPDLLARLHNLVRQLNRTDIRTVSSLISKVLGDQPAGQMAMRLLHWFPRAKKAGGWVYKSWRDWHAECNLSQAQVKRVHSQGILELIGIERTLMKANGTPTMHYRLDENKLFQRLADFLEVTLLRLQAWMDPQSPNEEGQYRPMNAADSAQLNDQNQPDEMDEDAPIHSAENAQSITDSALQTRQQNDIQDHQQDNHFAVVVHHRNETGEMLQSLKAFGISALRASNLIQQHGNKRLAEVIRHTKTQHCTNPAGYLLRALTENWTFEHKPVKDDYACGDGRAYFTGKYAAFINR